MQLYVHGHIHRNDTIAALATPPGLGGIAIIRISGERAIEIASQLTKKTIASQPSHTVRLRALYTHSGELIDRALVLIMKGPRSFTGEDTVEIHCHGGHLIAKRLLESLSLAGARPAEPGEFTMRAFLRGKIDLTRAEAIQALIGAKSETALRVAHSHLEGRLSEEIETFQKEGTSIAALFEAWVDFPEEGLEFSSSEEVMERLTKIKTAVERLIQTYDDGKILNEGIQTCLVGAPNVGKSSLMNALLGKERAIVSHIPGTTRDLIEEDASFNGIRFRLIDTAGIRETDELIEGEGIRRSLQAIERADLVLVLLDATRPHDADMLELARRVPPDKSILVWNKIDVQRPPLHGHHNHLSLSHTVYVSALTKEGFADLYKAIDRLIWSRDSLFRDEVMITSLRHKRALEEGLKCISDTMRGLSSGKSPELVSFDMRQFLTHMASVIGTDITEDVLDSVFSQFCVGK